MQTHLEFRSAALCDPEGVGNTYNPDILGKNLSEFLSTQFRSLGYNGNVIEEDWGWMVELASDPFPIWLGCANYESDDSWLVFIEPSNSVIRRWFRKVDTRSAVAGIAEKLENILVTHGGATDLKWWSDQDSGRK